jgi:SAM-dependent methyltransferase
MDSSDDQRSYWEHRLSGRLDVSTVGHIALGIVYNEWLYRMRRQALACGLRRFHIDPRGARVAELGAGSGAWIPFWEEVGAHSYTGYDITEASVSGLSKRYQQHRFIRADIGRALPVTEPYDLVTTFDVLFHLVGDVEFETAVGNIGRLLVPGGVAIVSDGFCTQAYGPFATEYHRSLVDYERAFASAGLKLEGFQPVFLSMHPGLCRCKLRHRLLGHFTRNVTRAAAFFARSHETEWINRYLGAGLYRVDKLLCPILDKGPSLNLAFLTRR